MGTGYEHMGTGMLIKRGRGMVGSIRKGFILVEK
jgi:hypothetical protein